ncbi:hypothetical protein ACIOHE_15765 [Streptomyces sp. NPDC087851]|uniref:hypothetical protein n=1 Tax=Streptomyces sp. NPDC087851 TaxID=3365810 RepID=UPI0037FA907D
MREITRAAATLAAPTPYDSLTVIAAAVGVLRTPAPGTLTRALLRLPQSWTPDTALGETETRASLHSVRELDAAYGRLGGAATVTGRALDTATVRITVTIPLHNGPVQAFTDWEPATETYGLDLPVVRALLAAGVSSR